MTAIIEAYTMTSKTMNRPDRMIAAISAPLGRNAVVVKA